MSNATEPVRSLRELTSDLARALDDAGRSVEALHAYRQALHEDGTTPQAAELYDAVGNVSERLGDSADALDAYLLATIDEPGRGTSAARALALLDDAEAVPQRAVDLAAKATSPSTAAATHRLLGHLRRIAGDADGALAALRRARGLADGPEQTEIAIDLVELMLDIGDAAGADEEVRTCDGTLPEDLVAEVRLAGGDFAEARGHAVRAGELGRAVAMLAALGLGEAATIEVGQPTDATETVAAAVAVHLARAEYDDARKLLIEAESVGVADSDALAVMRAQVLLEGAGRPGGRQSVSLAFAEVDEARRVLELVLGPAGDLAVPRWLRRQADVRGSDDRFRYAWAELLAGLGGDVARVRAAIEACPRGTTSLVQNAALDELLASPVAGTEAEAAAAWERAARGVDDAGDSGRAWSHIAKAVAAYSTPERRLVLADLAWRTSYDLDDERALERIARGLEVLDAESGAFAPEAGVDAAYTHALLVSLKAQRAPRETPATEIERTVPGVLAAMLAADDHYRALYAADVLGQADLRKSALYAARRCRDLASDDGSVPSYAANALAVAEANYGPDPASLEPLLDVLQTSTDGPRDPDYLRAIRLHMALMTGNRTDLERLLADIPPDGPSAGWQRWEWLAAVMLRDGVRSRPDSLRQIAEAADVSDWNVSEAATAWRLLGDLASADAVLAEAAERRLPSRRDQAALNDLVRQAPGAADELARLFASWHAPIEIFEWLNVTGPLLVDAFPELAEAVSRLDAVARIRLAELDGSPPPLEDELDLVPGAAGPGDVTRVLLRLLEGEFTANPAEVLVWAGRLRESPATGALRPALEAAADGVEQRVNARLGLNSPVPDSQTFLTPSPVAVELGAGIVDYVDSSKPEGERFIADQVETLRQVLKEERGVVVPGIRFRGAYMDSDDLIVRIGEVPVFRRRITLEPFTIQRDVLAAVRVGVTPYLARVVGPDAVDRLVGEWAESDDDLVSRVLQDAEARLRLTWVIQAALYDGLSVADWRLLLHAVERTGGIATPMPTLIAAVTHALRAAQAPPEEETRQLPAEIAAAFTDGTDATQAQHRLLGWLRDVVPVGQPIYLLVPDDIRDTVAALARTVSPTVVTYASSEVPR